FQRLPQETVLIERIDDQIGEHVVALAESEEQELFAQGVAERRGRGRPLRPVRRLLSAATGAARDRKIQLAAAAGAVIPGVLTLGMSVRGLRGLLQKGILCNSLVQFLHTLDRGKLQEFN